MSGDGRLAAAKKEMEKRSEDESQPSAGFQYTGRNTNHRNQPINHQPNQIMTTTLLLGIHAKSSRLRTHRNLRNGLGSCKPGTCHMMKDGCILTTAEARRVLLKRYWSDASSEKASG